MSNRNLIFAVIFFFSCIASYGMEYGLRFKSHSFPSSARTELSLNAGGFDFSNEISLGFEMAFYDKDCFGIICTMKGNDGTVVSLVSSSIDGNYQPGIVINESLNIIPVPFVATIDNPQPVFIKLNRKDNRATFIYQKESHEFSVDLSKMTSVSITFGRLEAQVSVAPIEIQDIRIFTDKQNTHSWELRSHHGDSVYDDINGAMAVAKSPHWIFDDHAGWSEIYKMTVDDKIQTAFDPNDELFYIAYPDKIVCYNPITQASRSIKTDTDGRAMKYSNYLVYDTLTNKLISYSPESRRSSRFDFSSGMWTPVVNDNQEPQYANHGYTSDGKHAYIFGGYGFYMFHNNLVKMDLETGEMEDITLYPLPDPRTSSSLCVKDDKLYIFGGMGNTIGKQEVPSKNYYDLWEYDINTMKGRKVWDMDTINSYFLPSSSMYYEERDSCFYFASTLFGGCMMSIGLNQPSLTVVSDEIHSKMDYRDCVFNLFRTKNGRRYYLVIDKRQNDFSHDYAIYTIAYPFKKHVIAADATNDSGNRGADNMWRWLCAGAVLLLISIAYTVYSSKRKSKRPAITSANPEELSVEDGNLPLTPDNSRTDSHANQTVEGDSKLVLERIPENGTTYFDCEKSSISFLGKYEIKDRFGTDITPKFTSRIKDLLILIVIYSDKDEKGISYKKIDEEIWHDKDEKSAKNNRNVYMRKLRILLEEVGKVEISYEKGYYRIDTRDILLDYHEAMSLINRYNSSDEGMSGENLDRLIELLLHGPLLPGITYEWLDKFKSSYTEISLHLLNKLLRHAVDNNDDDFAYRIAETISLHDPLSEEALLVKCRILFKRNMKGPAKSAYDSFYAEYEKSLGEAYPVPFSKIFRPTDED